MTKDTCVLYAECPWWRQHARTPPFSASSSFCSEALTVLRVAVARILAEPTWRRATRYTLTGGAPVDITCAEALSNAARNLTNAETISDLALMERLTAIANAWTDLAGMLAEREKV